MSILLFSANPAGQSAGMMAYLPFFLILAIMYFMMIRPQAKRQKEKRTMLESLKKGDKIVTIGGIHGTVAGFKGKEKNLILLKTDKNFSITVNRTAVSTLSINSNEVIEEELQSN